MSAITPMPVSLLAFKPVTKGALRGFAKVRVGKALTINDVSVLVSNGKAWASLPSKPLLDASGTALRDDKAKIKYVPIIEWSDRDTSDRFSAAVVEAVRMQFPDALASVA